LRNLGNAKNELIDNLKHIDKPIFVFIDDIDRLEKDEIFEVLRLVRNTAEFPQVIYIVSYDKHYILSQLKNKGISNGELYLEKIFPTEICLPKTDEYQLFSTFCDEILSMCDYSSLVNTLINQIDSEGRTFFANNLNTFRKVKRFASQFSINSSYLYKQKVISKRNIIDLYYIELINFIFPDSYNTLWKTPTQFLDVVLDEKQYMSFYELSETTIARLKKDGVSSSLIFLLEKLFGTQRKRSQSTIQMIDNLEVYFCLGTSDDILSEDEFQNVLKSGLGSAKKNEMYRIINRWCCGKNYKRITSIYNRFVSVNNIENENGSLSYLKCAICWIGLETRRDYFYDNLLPQVLKKSKFKSELLDTCKHYFLREFSKFFDSNNVQISVALGRLYEYVVNHDDLIINSDDVATLMVSNLKGWFFRFSRWSDRC